MVNIGKSTHYTEILLLVLLLGVPLSVHAGVFSYISSLFTTSQVSADQSQPNSQNMALLESIHSPTGEHFLTSKREIAIVGGTSLSPESQTIAPDAPEHTIEDTQISIYVVRPGDTLPAIAKMFGVTVNTIRWGNDIKGNTITPGQTLVILPISGIQHTVKSGETLQSITKLHKGDIDEILQYNNLTKDAKLAVGDVIVIPDGELSPSSTNASTKGSSVGVGIKGSATPVYDGYYMRPILGGIKTQGIHGHNGVDLASSYGSKIFASASGQVIISKNSGWNGGYGSYIVIKHDNGTQTLYGHLSGTAVSVGDTVTQGQVIGYMGTTGKSTGVHLHFEIRGAKNPF